MLVNDSPQMKAIRRMEEAEVHKDNSYYYSITIRVREKLLPLSTVSPQYRKKRQNECGFSEKYSVTCRQNGSYQTRTALINLYNMYVNIKSWEVACAENIKGMSINTDQHQ